jgi:hypothetical protein
MPYVDVNQWEGKGNWRNIRVFGGFLPVFQKISRELRAALLKSCQSLLRDL